MKKTLIALMALAGVAAAGTDLVYWAQSTGGDLLKIDEENGNMPYLGKADGGSRAGTDVIDSLTNVGDKTYTLHFRDNDVNVHFAVNEALYFDQIYTSATTITSYTIDFGAEGSITAGTNFDGWGGAIRFRQGASVTLNVAAGELNSLLGVKGEAGLYTRDLIITPATSANGVNGMWNVTDKLKVNLTGAIGYDYEFAKVDSIDQLQEGQYTYIVSGGDKITFAARAVPEPTTATLSLLALAGLAVRRRRK